MKYPSIRVGSITKVVMINSIIWNRRYAYKKKLYIETRNCYSLCAELWFRRLQITIKVFRIKVEKYFTKIRYTVSVSWSNIADLYQLVFLLLLSIFCLPVLISHRTIFQKFHHQFRKNSTERWGRSPAATYIVVVSKKI